MNLSFYSKENSKAGNQSTVSPHASNTYLPGTDFVSSPMKQSIRAMGISGVMMDHGNATVRTNSDNGTFNPFNAKRPSLHSGIGSGIMP